MKPLTRITLTDPDGIKFFGDGPFRLLRAVEQTGSLRSAAQSMGMAYSKALRILQQAEASLGFPLTIRSSGGKTGGGSTLTEEGRRFLNRYEAFREACLRENEALFRRYFPKTGCVIMASGLGKRFGGNKLMADFGGAPLIAGVISATEGLFHRRVVVTRHADVAQYCKERGLDVVLHSLPHRSDTVRLGLEALGDVRCCLFCPADQPLLSRETVAKLLNGWQETPDAIWRPVFESSPGAPVLFPENLFGELKNLPEGRGGNALLARYPQRVRTLAVARQEELTDVDTPEDLAKLETMTESE